MSHNPNNPRAIRNRKNAPWPDGTLVGFSPGDEDTDTDGIPYTIKGGKMRELQPVAADFLRWMRRFITRFEIVMAHR